ncbi:MAG: hypothetical protein IJ696_03415, partial [Ruminococcus sp.]|nr:hypothetical protein [Ruminococcus sp.]
LHIICLPAFRHITQILLDLRQQACVEFRQSDENLDGASDAQGSCGVVYKKARGSTPRAKTHIIIRSLKDPS